MNKTLILVGDKNKYFWPLIPPNEFYDVDEIYEKDYWMFPLWLRRKIPGLSYYKLGKLGEWKKRICKYDKIIIFDSAFTKQINKIIEKNHFENGCFFYFWNKVHATPVFAKRQIEDIGFKYKIYSFNMTDCIKYGFSYNSTFYYPYISKLGQQERKKPVDIIFLGTTKNEVRVRELDEICGVFKSLCISTWIHVCGTSDYVPNNFAFSSKKIDYSKYLHVVESCLAILDIDVYKENAYSLRTMEALFFDKKYITNNVNIKEADFYNPNNIFILGMDYEENLYDFVYSEVTPVKDEIKKKYLVSNWIERFKK